MRISVYASLESFFILCASILWCEVGYYYYIFHFKCHGWPEPGDTAGQQGLTRIMVLSDNHIMGPWRSFIIDKLIREWHMKQAFSISTSIYQPDVIIFLGDIFDEGSYSSDELFDKAKRDFENVFPHNSNRYERVIIPGNHDVGSHNQMISFPYLMYRFEAAFSSSSHIELLNSPKVNGLNIIAINSMSFYNDSCPYCSRSVAAADRISNVLKRQRNYLPPILLTHIPLYRLDDSQCDYPYSLKDKVRNENIEGKDVLHKSASKFLLSRFNPRLVLSGHTHMNCKISHKLRGDKNEVVDEITVSSFNHKYAEDQPSLLLLSVNKRNTYTKFCPLVDERVIVLIYITAIVLICFRSTLLRTCRIKKFYADVKECLIKDKVT